MLHSVIGNLAVAAIGSPILLAQTTQASPLGGVEVVGGYVLSLAGLWYFRSQAERARDKLDEERKLFEARMEAIREKHEARVAALLEQQSIERAEFLQRAAGCAECVNARREQASSFKTLTAKLKGVVDEHTFNPTDDE